MIGGKGYRTGTITIDEARKKFNEYYEARTGSPMGLLRAKLFDTMYQKKPSKTIKCEKDVIVDGKKTKECEKGSVKYLLDEGPRTFDIVGLDSFPENKMFKIEGKDYRSRGHSKKLKTDKITNIYGPRRKKDKKTYAEHERGNYNRRKTKDLDDVEKGFKAPRLRDNPVGVGNNLVDIYWEKFYGASETGTLPKNLQRRNKKGSGTVELLTFKSGAASYNNFIGLGGSVKIYKLLKKNDTLLLTNDSGIIINDSSDEYDYQMGYLQELGILDLDLTIPSLKTKIINFKITIKNDWDDIAEYYKLNVVTGAMNKITKGGIPSTPSRRKKFRNILAFWESKIDTVDIPEGADIEITDSRPVMTGGGGSGTILGYNFFD